jgi:gamma-glutamyltranspeptidase / glutathione hydrolase
VLDKTWTGYETAEMTVGAAAAANVEGADAAIRIMEAGGNAIDAAIAAAHVMGVVEPLDCGIGAGGFMIIHDAASGRVDSIDFLGTAPASAHYELFATNNAQGEYVIRVKGNHNQVGHRAVATPGTLAGFAEMHAKYGKLPMPELFTPAIELAEGGFAVSYKGALRMGRTIGMLNHTEACRALYLKSETEAPAEGDWLVNRDYGATLRLIAKQGAGAFYEGDIAQAILAETRAHDGFLSAEDLRGYKALWREPARGRFQGLDVATMAPPSSGGLVFAGLDALSRLTPQSEAETHEALARAMLHMFEKRRVGFGDPAFMPPAAAPNESAETTSLCTLDAAGNAACVTYSNNNHSGVVVPGTGILLNNQMALFSPWPDNPNQVIGGKRPVSSMMPTLLSRGGKVEMAIGASGSTRIPTSLMQVLHRVLVQGKSIIDAIAEPKLHAEVETMMADEDLQSTASAIAAKLGLAFRLSPGRDTTLGVVQAIHAGWQGSDHGKVTAIGDSRAKAQGRVR